jgi:hypothetical protein
MEIFSYFSTSAMGDLRPPTKRWENKLRIVHLPKHMIEGLGGCLAIERESLILNCIQREFIGKKWAGFFVAIVVVT